MPDLVLTDDHRYFLGEKELDGVTTVIRDMGIMGYMPNDQYYLDRGTFVHEAIHLYFKGQLDESSLSEGVKPYVDSAIEYITVTGYKPAHVEISLYDPVYLYAGTPDAIPLRDWKNSGKTPWHRLQIAAYWNLCRVNKIETETPMTVHLNSKGKLPKVEPYTIAQLREELKTFLCALNLYKWKKEK